MSKDFDGFYLAYLTGALGSSLAMYTFKEGKMAGADVGGGKYRGTYIVDVANNQVNCLIEFLGLPNTQSIGGGQFGENPKPIQMPVTIPFKINPADIIKIETPLGAINAKFEKLQKF